VPGTVNRNSCSACLGLWSTLIIPWIWKRVSTHKRRRLKSVFLHGRKHY